MGLLICGFLVEMLGISLSEFKLKGGVIFSLGNVAVISRSELRIA